MKVSLPPTFLLDNYYRLTKYDRGEKAKKKWKIIKLKIELTTMKCEKTYIVGSWSVDIFICYCFVLLS